MILKHQFQGATNQQLANLCGPLGRHLQLISSSLNVKLTRRQDAFRVEGAKVAATRAMEILQALFELSKKPILEETVQLMLAGDGMMDKPKRNTQKTPLPELTENSSTNLPDDEMGVDLHTRRSDLRARTTNQAHYLYNILHHDLTFGIGPAGTGKTFLAVACAADALELSQVQRVILTIKP